MEENEILQKLESLEQRVSFLEDEIATIKQINQSEKVKEYITATEKARKIAKLLDASNDKEILSEKVETSIDNEMRETFSDIPSINGLQSAKKFVGNTDRIVNEQIEKLEAVTSQCDWSNIFEYSNNDGYVRIDGYIGFDEKCVVVPKMIDGMVVTEIGDSVFESCKSLQEVILPNSIVKIGEKAFMNSTLEKINLPEGVCEIGIEAFSGSKLYEISIPSTLGEISRNTFYFCFNLTKVMLPKGLKIICRNAFYNCKKLYKIDIPEGVTTIGYDAFYSCDMIYGKKVYLRIPDSVRSIANNIFGSQSRCAIFIYCNAGSYAMKYARNLGVQIRRYEDFDLLEG
jgi:hypothetical protein